MSLSEKQKSKIAELDLLLPHKPEYITLAIISAVLGLLGGLLVTIFCPSLYCSDAICADSSFLELLQRNALSVYIYCLLMAAAIAVFCGFRYRVPSNVPTLIPGSLGKPFKFVPTSYWRNGRAIYGWLFICENGICYVPKSLSKLSVADGGTQALEMQWNDIQKIRGTGGSFSLLLFSRIEIQLKGSGLYKFGVFRGCRTLKYLKKIRAVLYQSPVINDQ